MFYIRKGSSINWYVYSSTPEHDESLTAEHYELASGCSLLLACLIIRYLNGGQISAKESELISSVLG
jgi:hypothetical protein